MAGHLRLAILPLASVLAEWAGQVQLAAAAVGWVLLVGPLAVAEWLPGSVTLAVEVELRSR